MIFLLVAAALVVGAPLGAAILVSFASRREDAAHTLTGRPPGPVTAMARRLLCSPTEASGRTATSRRAANGIRATTTEDPADSRRSRLSRTGPELPRPRAAADAVTGSWPSSNARTDTLTLPRT